jgi:hypothetical protein
MSPAETSVLTLKHAILGGGHTTPIERLAATERKALDVALNIRFSEHLTRLGEHLGPKVVSELEAAKPNYSVHRDRSLVEALKAVLEKSRARKLSKAQGERIDASLEDVAGAVERVADVLELDVPIGNNSLLEEPLERFLTREIGRIAGFNNKTLKDLEKEEVNLTRPGEARIDDLVSRKVITEGEGLTLSYLGALNRLSGSNLTLIEALHGGDGQSVRDFITWDSSDWEKLIEDNNIAVPEGEKDASDYAESLSLTMERSFPSDYLALRIAKERFDTELKLIDEILALKKDNAALIRDGVVDETAVNTKGLSAEATKKLQGSLIGFGQLVKTYRHMGIADVANDERLTPGEKFDVIERRLSGLKVFFDNNSNIDIYVANFVDNSIEFNWKNIGKQERAHIKAQLRAMQRVSVLTDDAKTSLKLLKAGFSSSAEITAVSEEKFLQASGLDQFDGRALYARAYENTLAVSHLYEGIREASSGVFDQLRVSNTPNLISTLRNLDGYTDLFGGENYCNCEHCRSLLSPSAYFVDLMKFIDDNVSKKIAGSPEDNSQIFLEKRRPDLWTLDLTCTSAKTELPYLEIVNEVLTRFLINSDLNTLENVAGVTVELATAKNSFALPVDLNLEELRLYLGEFDMCLADVYNLLDQDLVTIRRERLSISAEELVNIITPEALNVAQLFGDLPINGMDLQDFMKFASVSREEVTALLSVRALPKFATVSVKIIEDQSDIQLFSEQLIFLTNEQLVSEQVAKKQLDVIHRFLRLSRKIGYSIAETDLMLVGLQDAELMETLESTTNGMPAVLWFAPLFQLQDMLDLSAEEVAAFAGLLPGSTLIEGAEGLYDRLFDRVGIFEELGTDILGRTVLNEIAPLSADPTQDTISGLLAGGLGVSESELVELLVLHSLDQAITMADVTSLYRHARMARGLGVSITDLVGLIELALGPNAMASIDNFVTVSKLSAWVKGSPFSIDLLRLIISGRQSPSESLTSSPEAATSIVLAIQQTMGTEQAEDAHKYVLLSAALQDRYNLTAEQLETTFLGHFTAIELAAQGIDDALATTFTDGQPDTPDSLNPLIALMRELERTTRLFATLGLSVEAIDNVAANQSDFGIVNLNALTLSDIRALVSFTSLLRVDRTRETSLLEAMRAFPALPDETVATLAQLFDAPQTLISSVIHILTSLAEPLVLPTEPIAAFSKISSMVGAAKKIGIDGFSLAKLRASDSDQELAEARNVAFAAVQAKYPEDAKRADRLATLAELTNTRRRDALAAFIIAQHADFQFKDRADLYNFFLLDVEMGGCFLTTPVICAISSLQSYINRCLLSIEEKVDPAWIPAKEWGWRRNYRVWEVNRKFFLYPETYLDPALRQDKSHLFEALEQELLQQKITLESAEGAYKRYLAGFTELTELRYAGAFSKTRNNFPPLMVPEDQNSSQLFTTFSLPANIEVETDSVASQGVATELEYFQSAGSYNSKFYFFARTAKDPYQYFYRTYQRRGDAWGSWIRMDLPIGADRISAVMHRGRIYVFWNEVKYKETNKISSGNANSTGVRFEVTTKYSWLNENGEWTTVQQMPLGMLWRSPENIFSYVMDSPPSDEDGRDKIKEEVYGEYMRQVFGKPYATLTNKIESPINLGYIWPHGQKAAEVSYWSAGVVLKPQNHQIAVPAFRFTVINEKFAEASPWEGALLINARSDSGQTYQYSGQAKAIIKNATECILTIESGFSPFSISVGAQSPVIGVHTTMTGISLLRNEILEFSPNPIDARTSPSYWEGYRSIASRKHLEPEYWLSVRSDGQSAFHVENGSISFTKTERVVTQDASGNAFLSLPGTVPVQTNTVLTDALGEILFGQGLEAFLSLRTQQFINSSGQELDFDGPYGLYYWELFFHIPFLIAKHFNANQKFEEAKWWYERIFDPTSSEKPDDERPADRNWRFREFRNKDADTLKDILTDEAAIAAYKNDPFNPHAIAKLRHSAYQKAVVIEYVDNLIDWANALFARDTREAVNEATMLYIFAREVLGERPVQVGECMSKDPLIYTDISDAISEGSEFLILLENEAINRRNHLEFSVKPVRAGKALEAALRAENELPRITRLEDIRRAVETRDVTDKIAELRRALADDEETEVRFANGDVVSAKEAIRSNRLKLDLPFGQPVMRQPTSDNTVVAYRDVARNKIQDIDRIAEVLDIERDELAQHMPSTSTLQLPAGDVTEQSIAAFCAPHNPNLLALWDRIDMQLIKIRNCQNISGAVRSLAITEPPLDPMMFLRARAAGLSLEDIAAIGPGAEKQLVYRFSSLLPVAKQAAQMVQGFGQSLLSALEKKDAEELRLLQLTHERNIQSLTRSVKQRQIKEAEEQLTAAGVGLARAEINLNYYVGLIESGLNGWETTEQVSTHVATGFKISENQAHLASGLLYLVSQFGSAFAMKYGGKELGDSAKAYAAVNAGLGAIASQVAQSAGLEARAQRREQDWKHQRNTARADVKIQKASHAAAEIRHALAEKDLEVHERIIDQTIEIEEFHEGKFTGLSLYNHLASKLSRIYRSAYSVAQDLARVTERAYQFETDDKTSFFIASDNWDQSHAGMLAGEQLTVQLAAMEADFLNINTRRPEIQQTFSLAMLDPNALVQLRQTGTCRFSIPEVAFEVLYPGQYRRLIKAVRVSVPAVVGPYTNVSAKLTLVNHWIEGEDGDGIDLNQPAPLRDDAISLSGAINDAGMFEFAYRDDRFLPFEGVGAISHWQLDLPSSIRSFDYDTIADVMFHLDYTALDGDRDVAEAALASMINDHAANSGLFRLISLSHEFPTEWARLTGPAPGVPQDVVFTLTDAHFPHLFRNREVQISAITVYLKPNSGTLIDPPDLRLNNIDIVWDASLDIERPGALDDADKLKVGTVVGLNGLAKGPWQFSDGEGKLDSATADDLMILIHYTVTI